MELSYTQRYDTGELVSPHIKQLQVDQVFYATWNLSSYHIIIYYYFVSFEKLQMILGKLL